MFFLCTYVFRKICTPQVGPRGQGWDGNEVKAELANSDCSVHGLHGAGATPPLGPASHTNRMSNWGQVPDVYKRGENRSRASGSARSRRCASTPSPSEGTSLARPGRGTTCLTRPRRMVLWASGHACEQRPGPRLWPAHPHLFQPSPLLLLLLDPLLSLRQQLPLVFLLLPELLLLQELLPPQGLGALLVLLLQPQEVPAQRGLARHVDDGAAGGSGALRGAGHSTPTPRLSRAPPSPGPNKLTTPRG